MPKPMIIENIKQAIPVLEELIRHVRSLKMETGHAQKFFDVGEFDLAFEEITHTLKNDKLNLPAAYAEQYEALSKYFEQSVE